MNITTLLKQKNDAPYENRPVTIGFLGDSVTNGCFEVVPAILPTGEESADVIYDARNGYTAKLHQILNMLYPRAQINIINAGISGDCAHGGLARMDRDLLPYKPDLTIVAFGANDCGCKEEGLARYHDSLVEIVRKLKEAGSEVILMTEHLICSKLHTQLKGEVLRQIGKDLSANFHAGYLDMYLDQMRLVAKEEQVALCDVNAKWKALYNAGVDTDDLLCNYLNHPTRDMHWLFAVSLAETIFGI